VRVVILGAGGQLAYDLQRVMEGWDLTTLRHADLDVCDHDRVRSRLNDIRPDVVINTAAFHRVDDCEEQIRKAFEANTFAVRNLARLCAELNSVLVHISTDYVFGGEKRTPYAEADLPHPLGVYGASKLAGEYFVRNDCPNHLLVRTSGLYGIAGSSGKGGNFVETMIRMAKEGEPIRVVEDQVLTPTWTRSLAETMKELLEKRSRGLYHVTNRGACSWYDFAARIFDLVGKKPDLAPITTEAYGARARRPAYSVLGHGRMLEAGIAEPPDWEDSLRGYLVERGHI